MQSLSIDEAYALSRDLYDREDYAEAAKVLLRILEVQDDIEPALEHLGLVFLANQQIGLAATVADKLLALGPDDLDRLRNVIQISRTALVASNLKHVHHTDRPPQTGPARDATPAHVMILCGGAGARWQGYQDTQHKHLVTVAGDVLVQRTLDLVARQNVRSTVVLVPEGAAATFQDRLPAGTEIRVARQPLFDAPTPAWKYLSSKPHWAKDAPNVLLLGDVWFSEQAIATIFAPEHSAWTAFGRYHASTITGCPHGEIFALKFRDVAQHYETAKLLDQLYKAKLCTEEASGWALLQMINGENPNIRSPGRHFVNINDFTEDFDFPEDYDRWVENYTAPP